MSLLINNAPPLNSFMLPSTDIANQEADRVHNKPAAAIIAFSNTTPPDTVNTSTTVALLADNTFTAVTATQATQKCSPAKNKSLHSSPSYESGHLAQIKLRHTRTQSSVYVSSLLTTPIKDILSTGGPQPVEERESKQASHPFQMEYNTNAEKPAGATIVAVTLSAKTPLKKHSRQRGKTCDNVSSLIHKPKIPPTLQEDANAASAGSSSPIGGMTVQMISEIKTPRIKDAGILSVSLPNSRRPSDYSKDSSRLSPQSALHDSNISTPQAASDHESILSAVKDTFREEIRRMTKQLALVKAQVENLTKYAQQPVTQPLLPSPPDRASLSMALGNAFCEGIRRTRIELDSMQAFVNGHAGSAQLPTPPSNKATLSRHDSLVTENTFSATAAWQVKGGNAAATTTHRIEQTASVIASLPQTRHQAESLELKDAPHPFQANCTTPEAKTAAAGAGELHGTRQMDRSAHHSTHSCDADLASDIIQKTPPTLQKNAFAFHATLAPLKLEAESPSLRHINQRFRPISLASSLATTPINDREAVNDSQSSACNLSEPIDLNTFLKSLQAAGGQMTLPTPPSLPTLANGRSSASFYSYRVQDISALSALPDSRRSSQSSLTGAADPLPPLGSESGYTVSITEARNLAAEFEANYHDLRTQIVTLEQYLAMHAIRPHAEAASVTKSQIRQTNESNGNNCCLIC